MKAKRKLGMGLPLLAANMIPHVPLTRRKKRRTKKKRSNRKGGFLPLLPILGALATAGSVGSNLSNIVKAAGDVKNFFVPNKKGSGFRKKRRRKTNNRLKGRGLYLNPPNYYNRK